MKLTKAERKEFLDLLDEDNESGVIQWLLDRKIKLLMPMIPVNDCITYRNLIIGIVDEKGAPVLYIADRLHHDEVTMAYIRSFIEGMQSSMDEDDETPQDLLMRAASSLISAGVAAHIVTGQECTVGNIEYPDRLTVGLLRKRLQELPDNLPVGTNDHFGHFKEYGVMPTVEKTSILKTIDTKGRQRETRLTALIVHQEDVGPIPD